MYVALLVDVLSAATGPPLSVSHSSSLAVFPIELSTVNSMLLCHSGISGVRNVKIPIHCQSAVPLKVPQVTVLVNDVT